MHAHAEGYPGLTPPHWRMGERTISPEAMLSPVTSECVKTVFDRYLNRFLWFCGVDPRAVRNLPDSDLSAGSGCNAITRDPDYAAAFLTEFQDRIFYACDITTPTAQHPYRLAVFLDELLQNGQITKAVYQKICRGNAEKILSI